MLTADPATTQHPRGAELAEAADRVIPGGVNSATRFVGEPFAFAGAHGAHVTDLDGHRYLDYHAALGAVLLGHGDPGVTAAVHAAVDGLGLVGLGVSELEVRLAAKVCEVMPSAERMLATTSGSEATAQAIRLARAATGRPLVIKFQGGFHGWHDAVARNVISPPGRAYRMDPLSAGILPEALESTLVAEFNDLDSVVELLRTHPEQVAAIILEPVPHNVGALLPEPEFIHGLRRLSTEHGVVLVLDEVITGFRHALGGYQEVIGLTPDVTTFGKGMANGYGIGGIAGRADLMEHFDRRGGDVLVAGTFNGHPVSCAAALATIEHLQTHPDFYRRTHALGARLRQGLGQIVDRLGIRAHPAGFGGVFALYFTPRPPRGYRDLLQNDGRAYVEFHRRMTRRGHLMLPLALKRNHVSGAHTAEDVEQTLAVADEVLAQMLTDGVAPRR